MTSQLSALAGGLSEKKQSHTTVRMRQKYFTQKSWHESQSEGAVEGG